MSDNGEISKDNDQYFSGFYKARVDNNGYDINYIGEDSVKDEFNRNRVQLRILGLHSFDMTEKDVNYIPIKVLPWGEQSGSLFGGFGNDESGDYVLPSVGSWVWIFFENGNANKPVYFGTVIGNKDLDETNSYIFNRKTKSGTKIKINDNVNDDVENKAIKITIETSKGTSIIIDDTDDKEIIEFKTKDGQTLSLDNTKDNEQILIKDTVNENEIKMDKNGIIIKDKKGEIEMSKGKIIVKGDVIMAGGSLKADGTCIPEGKGGFLAIPSCIFSGVPIASTKIGGT